MAKSNSGGSGSGSSGMSIGQRAAATAAGVVGLVSGAVTPTPTGVQFTPQNMAGTHAEQLGQSQQISADARKAASDAAAGQVNGPGYGQHPPKK